MIAFFSSFDYLGLRRPEIEVILSKNSVSMSKKDICCLDIVLIMFFSKTKVTSGRFSLKGKGTFLPLDLSS